MTRMELEREILAWMAEADRGDWQRDDARFAELALALFAFQYQSCDAYRRYCEGRGASLEKVRDWRAIPAVPTGAFKEVALRCFPAEREIATFRTSGTSGAPGARRGELHLDSLALYEASLLPTIRRHLFPDLAADERMPILVLTPSADELPDSSLSHMFSCAVARIGSSESAFFVHRGELRLDALRERLVAARTPVAVCGTAFAFVHLLEGCSDPFELPEGSRILETGGFKGRSREIPRAELHTWIESGLGVPRDRIVNQYGMTELGSQFYDSVLAEPDAPRRKLGPPWVRVRLIDPTSDREVEPGRPGTLVIHDLANTGSVAAVMTADLGVQVDASSSEPGFDVLGREPGAEERGCSLAADLMLSR